MSSTTRTRSERLTLQAWKKYCVDMYAQIKRLCRMELICEDTKDKINERLLKGLRINVFALMELCTCIKCGTTTSLVDYQGLTHLDDLEKWWNDTEQTVLDEWHDDINESMPVALREEQDDMDRSEGNSRGVLIRSSPETPENVLNDGDLTPEPEQPGSPEIKDEEN